MNAKNVRKVERALLCLTNLHRLRNGIAPLREDTRLSKAARRHSNDMVRRRYFDHVTPEGKTPGDRAAEAGYPQSPGENIATSIGGGAFTLFDMWRNSPGHNGNMLNPQVASGGFGIAHGWPFSAPPDGEITGTQMFSGVANTRYTGFDLYANNSACARAKKTKFAKQAQLRRLRKARARATGAQKRRRLARAIRRTRADLQRAAARSRNVCRPPQRS